MAFVKVQIGTEADDADLRKYEQQLRRLDKAADDFISTMKLGAGIDIGGRLVGALASAPALIAQAIQRGIAFNVTMADSESAVASVVQKFAGLNKEAAKNEAAKAMAEITRLEAGTAATLEGMTQGLLATAGAAQAAGVSLTENVDLVARFANAMARLNIPAEQLSQEMRAIFSGNITSDAALGKTLNISNESINRAKEAGTMYAYLKEQIGELGEQADGFAVKFSSLESAIDKTLGAVTQGATEEIGRAAEILTKQISDPKTSQALQQLGHDLAGLVANGAKLIGVMVRNADVIASLARHAGLLAVAFAALKIKDVVIGLGLKIVTVVRSTAAIQAETAAVNANTAAQAKNAAARGGGGGSRMSRVSAMGGLAAPAAVLGAGIGLGLEMYTNAKYGDINDGVAGALSRTGAMRSQIGGADSPEAQKKAWDDLHTTLSAITNEMATASGQRLQSLNTEYSYLSNIRDRFSEIVGKEAEQAKIKAVKETQNSRELESLRSQAQIQALRAAGMEKEAQAVEDRLAAEKQIEQIMKANPGLDAATVKAEVEAMVAGQRNAQRTAELAQAQDGFRDATETPEQRLARLQAEFQTATGNAAPANGTAGDLEGLAGTSAKGLEIARQILDTQRAIEEATNSQGEEARKALQDSIDRADRLAEAKRDVEEEVTLQEALVRGDKARVAEIEKQRALRAEIATLQAAGMTADQAQEQALRKVNAQLDAKKAAEDKEKAGSRGIAQAELELEKAKGGKSKSAIRNAEDELFRRQEQKRFEGAGFSETEAARLAGESVDARSRQRRRADGTIGGSARRSPLDRLGGGIDNLADLRTPLAEKIAQPAMAPAATAQGGKGADPASAAVDSAAAGLNGVPAMVSKIVAAVDKLATALKAQEGKLDQVAAAVDRIDSAPAK